MATMTLYRIESDCKLTATDRAAIRQAMKAPTWLGKNFRLGDSGRNLYMIERDPHVEATASGHEPYLMRVQRNRKDDTYIRFWIS